MQLLHVKHNLVINIYDDISIIYSILWILLSIR